MPKKSQIVDWGSTPIRMLVDKNLGKQQCTQQAQNNGQAQQPAKSGRRHTIAEAESSSNPEINPQPQNHQLPDQQQQQLQQLLQVVQQLLHQQQQQPQHQQTLHDREFNDLIAAYTLVDERWGNVRRNTRPDCGYIYCYYSNKQTQKLDDKTNCPAVVRMLRLPNGKFRLKTILNNHNHP